MPANKIIIEEVKNPNESNASLLRRFNKRVQIAQIHNLFKKKMFAERPLSKTMKKRNALRRLEKKAEIERLRKLGKIA